ncbi:hypothetical protein CP532_5294 [Ophiocordyceps camponoti-leonardi (nom. inval.)]|nr:hypothetical protein CP532_5294 [Ophiocordyceps camponoti-leonardi (nom. inval.)]
MPPAESDDGAGSMPHNFYLTPHQQSLLFAALDSNRQAPASFAVPAPVSLSPTSFQSSPLSSLDRYNGVEGYDYVYSEPSFDFSFASLRQPQSAIDGPATVKSDSTEADSSEKRNHPDDDDEAAGNDSKRHEGSEKAPKKPGRKPLTSEPTSKRKAQNRAAQRAFRERKEKHLQDLETKVHELEKASEAANHENSKLRLQIDGITAELNHYKQRLAALNSTTPKVLTSDGLPLGTALIGNITDLNFPFEFPKFGADNASAPNGHVPQRQSHGGKSSPSPVRPSAHDRLPSMASSRASVDLLNGGATSSPSASSNSNAGGAVSSCGTSPEPANHSPMGFKPLETLTTIGEEQPAAGHQSFANGGSQAPALDWLTSQNGGQFDPQLFGDYREPQDNILSGANLDDFFNDSFDADFITPYNMPMASVAPAGPKRNLIDQIDAEQNALDEDVPTKDQKNVPCTKIWDRLQGCPKAQTGEFDLDGLCSELTSKAKCSGHGPVVAERDFDSILRKYMGKDVSPQCFANSLGIEVHPDEKPNNIVMP